MLVVGERLCSYVRGGLIEFAAGCADPCSCVHRADRSCNMWKILIKGDIMQFLCLCFVDVSRYFMYEFPLLCLYDARMNAITLNN